MGDGFTKEELKHLAEAVLSASQVVMRTSQDTAHCLDLMKAHGLLLGLSLTAQSSSQINNKVC